MRKNKDIKSKRSLASAQLELAAPLKGDSLLVYSHDIAGIYILEAAKKYELKLFYCDECDVRRRIAEEMGAEIFCTQEEIVDYLSHASKGEGMNIIIDLTAEKVSLSVNVNAILSQAGRIVLGNSSRMQESYQMRMCTYKEADIYGLGF